MRDRSPTHPCMSEAIISKIPCNRITCCDESVIAFGADSLEASSRTMNSSGSWIVYDKVPYKSGSLTRRGSRSPAIIALGDFRNSALWTGRRKASMS
jgi:hypothetical protein